MAHRSTGSSDRFHVGFVSGQRSRVRRSSLHVYASPTCQPTGPTVATNVHLFTRFTNNYFLTEWPVLSLPASSSGVPEIGNRETSPRAFDGIEFARCVDFAEALTDQELDIAAWSAVRESVAGRIFQKIPCNDREIPLQVVPRPAP